MTTWSVPARVVRVVDGDTVVLDLDLGWRIWRLGERCRLAGINCPELSTLEGAKARAFVSDLVGVGRMVTFTSHSLDKYGRPLGHVTLSDGRNLNVLILDAGYAQPA